MIQRDSTPAKDLSINGTRATWVRRLQQDEKFRDDHIFSMDQMIEAAHGPHYTRRATAKYMPWNHYHSYTSLMVGRLMFDNPQVVVNSRRSGPQKETVEAIGHGLNRWIKDTNLREVGQKLAVDFCYSWYVVMVRQVANKFERKTTEQHIFEDDGTLAIKSEESLWPAVYRIPQNLFLVDSGALTFEDANYMGHKWYSDADDLLETAKAAPKSKGWNVADIKALGSGAQSSTGEAGAVDPLREARSLGDVGNGQIELVTIWEAKDHDPTEGKGPDEGYHGTLMTMAKVPGGNSDNDWLEIQSPQPYYGPPEGPYVVCGAYTLPNRMWPLSPLVAVEANIRAVNRQARAVERSNEKHKRVGIYNQRDTKAAQAIRRAQHDYWIGIEGFAKDKFVEAEIGGATEGQYKGAAWSMEQLQRVSAMDDAQQGTVTGRGTATENQIANNSTETRIEYLKQQFADGIMRILKRVSWFLYHDNKVLFPVGQEAADDAGVNDAWFEGGEHESDSNATFDDLEMEIEAYSMQRMGQESMLQATTAALEYLFTTMPMRVQFPFADWDEIDRMVSKSLGVPNLDQLIDNEAAAQQQPFQEGAQNEQPRLSVDVGRGYGQGQASAPAGAPPARAPQSLMAQASGSPGGNAGLSMIGAA